MKLRKRLAALTIPIFLSPEFKEALEFDSRVPHFTTLQGAAMTPRKFLRVQTPRQPLCQQSPGPRISALPTPLHQS